MDKIYLINRYYDNGESYDLFYDETEIIHAFATEEEAIQYIREIKLNPECEWVENSYLPATTKLKARSFSRKKIEYEDIFETLYYSITEIPFGNENKI